MSYTAAQLIKRIKADEWIRDFYEIATPGELFAHGEQLVRQGNALKGMAQGLAELAKVDSAQRGRTTK